jgi:hypothetical protein
MVCSLSFTIPSLAVIYRLHFALKTFPVKGSKPAAFNSRSRYLLKHRCDAAITKIELKLVVAGVGSHF